MSIFLLLAPNLSFAQTLVTDTLLQARIEQVSARFVGLVYKASPLGEASGIDTDPLIRFDAFDCTTFVETVGAVALSGGQATSETVKVMNEIRYADGKPSFVKRNHFVSLDWIPNNVKKGILEDITETLFPKESYQIHTIINKGNWFEKNFNIKTADHSEEATLNVISVHDLLAHEELAYRIPSGSGLSFVVYNPTIEQKIGTDLDVTHQGLLIQKNGQLILRHAKGLSFGVMEEPFLEYIKKSQDKLLYAISVTRFKQK